MRSVETTEIPRAASRSRMDKPQAYLGGQVLEHLRVALEQLKMVRREWLPALANLWQINLQAHRLAEDLLSVVHQSLVLNYCYNRHRGSPSLKTSPFQMQSTYWSLTNLAEYADNNRFTILQPVHPAWSQIICKQFKNNILCVYLAPSGLHVVYGKVPY